MERGLGWLLGQEPDPHSDFPAWLFTSSLSLTSCLSCLSLYLDLFMSLFEIMQRTKFLIWPTSPLAGQAPLGEHFLSPRLSFLFCEMGIKSSQHREGEMSVGCAGLALLSAPLVLLGPHHQGWPLPPQGACRSLAPLGPEPGQGGDGGGSSRRERPGCRGEAGPLGGSPSLTEPLPLSP